MRTKREISFSSNIPSFQYLCKSYFLFFLIMQKKFLFIDFEAIETNKQ